MQPSKADILSRLQNEIFALQHSKPANGVAVRIALGAINDAFPHKEFPIGAIHEFIAKRPVEQSATGGFISGIISALMQKTGAVVWIGGESIFPPALKTFGIAPERIIFIDGKNQKQVLWVIEEALKCTALAAVIGEVNNLDFTASRRLQLAVETSKVTGFIIRKGSSPLNTNACFSRWQVTPLKSSINSNIPGPGFPRWKVNLMKVRNGKPGTWDIEWSGKCFRHIEKSQEVIYEVQRKVS